MQRVLQGVAAAPGLVAGPVRRWGVPAEAGVAALPHDERATAGQAALRALDAAAAELEALSEQLERDDHSEEAEIVGTGALMAHDPGLRESVLSEVHERGRSAAAALLYAGEVHAQRLGALDDPLFAARAADVRSTARRAARIAGGASGGAPPDGVLVGDDLGPADVAELGACMRGIALRAGSTSGHATIVARSLGVPLVLGLGDALDSLHEGSLVVMDGDAGVVIVDPAPQRVRDAEAAEAQRREATLQAVRDRALPARTRDGHDVAVLANASSAAEVEVALRSGGEGVGLLRAELAFLEAGAWPARDDHLRLLAPVVAALRGLPLTVRLLDFGGDKTPPFLAGTRLRGIDLLLQAPVALEAQLDAIVVSGGTLRVLVPMVVEPAQVLRVRAVLDRVAARHGLTAPPVGAMIEVPAAVSLAPELAAVCDFFSIGTNDLAHFHLGVERSVGGAPVQHPAVLRLIERTVRAAHARHLHVAVCGEAAADPHVAPLLIGLGVDELSVGAARVGETRALVRATHHGDAVVAAQRALHAAGAEAALTPGVRAG